MRRVAVPIAALLCSGLLGCDTTSRDLSEAQASLRAVEGCADLETMLRESAIQEMRTRVMENYQYALEGYGCGGYYDYDDAWNTMAEAADGDADYDRAGADEEGASEYSTTNTQEVGVDEADFIKNDGSYIYIVAGQEFLIIDAWPAPSTEIISRVELNGLPQRLYVHEDHAVVYANVVDEDATGYGDCYWDDYRGDYSCGAAAQGTVMYVFDITDRTAPKLEREIELSGVYVNSRRVEDFVHTVMTYPEISFPDVSYWPEGLDFCNTIERTRLWRAFAALIEENIMIIQETPLEDWLPTISETIYDDSGTPSSRTDLLGDCHGFYEAVGSSGRSFISVMSFDMLEHAGDINVTSIVGDQGVVYASRSALYVASRQYASDMSAWYFDSADGYDEATTIHRFEFDLDEPVTTYDSSGVVPGRILNQFSMGEHLGFLRLATTVGYLPSPDCSNNVYVLEPKDGVLEITGSITGIAPTEDIRSARFVEDRGFIVTFKKTDPLFIIDLEDPDNPHITGELHIPGFSTYMHVMDDDHILSIGFDAEDQGSFAYFQGVQLQIFDVSDMTDPQRIHLEIIGTRGTSSEATGNHLAFNYFPPHDLLAIPMAICEGDGSGGTYGDVMTFNGLLVYDVTVEEGFSERGRLDHGASTDEYSCYSWWTDANSQVKRSVIMDDFIFSVASDRILVAHVDQLSEPVASVELPQVPDDGYTYGY